MDDILQSGKSSLLSLDDYHSQKKGILKQIRLLNVKLRHVSMELSDAAAHITDYTCIGGKPSEITRQAEQLMLKMEDLRTLIAEYEQELENLNSRFRQTIQLLDSPQSSDYRDILDLRDIQNMSWNDIAVIMGYCPRHCSRIRHTAIEILCQKLS